MAFLKVLRYARRHGFGSTVGKVFAEFPGYLRRIYLWRIRRCGCCERLSVFLCNGISSEFRTCIFCSANERYELLAAELRERYGSELSNMEVLELDPHSPLRKMLSCARKHVRSFYDPEEARGSLRPDGTVCQDITALTYGNESFDLIVSSDVLEHVPSLESAFGETRRVLKPGRVHLFTVPSRPETKKRAEMVGTAIRHLESPEYHCDPLCSKGILAFWDLGPDLDEKFGSDSLRFSVVRGPTGPDKRTVWMAQRPTHKTDRSPDTEP
jgi:SAM-dependent methyltransferase